MVKLTLEVTTSQALRILEFLDADNPVDLVDKFNEYEGEMSQRSYESVVKQVEEDIFNDE